MGRSKQDSRSRRRTDTLHRCVRLILRKVIGSTEQYFAGHFSWMILLCIPRIERNGHLRPALMLTTAKFMAAGISYRALQVSWLSAFGRRLDLTTEFLRSFLHNRALLKLDIRPIAPLPSLALHVRICAVTFAAKIRLAPNVVSD